MSNIINTIGFADKKMLEKSQLCVRIGAAAIGVGSMILAYGIMLNDMQQEWFHATTNEGIESIRKCYSAVHGNVTN